MPFRRPTFSICVAVLLASVHGLTGQALNPAVTTIAIAPACPALGGTASWIASATGGTSPIQYRFWLRNDTAGTWTLLADYSAAAAAAWTPTAPGRYFTQVWVRSSESSADWEGWMNSAPCVVSSSAALSVTTVTAAPASGPVMSSILWTVGATGGVAPLEFQFWLRNNTTLAWSLLRDYGTSNTVTWTPATPGSYMVQVWARSAGSVAAWESWNNSGPVSIYLPVTVTGVTPTPLSPGPGTLVTWSAAVTGGLAPLQYRFYLRNGTTGSWTVLQDYGPSSTAMWTPPTAGTYYVQVWVRSAGSTAAFEGWNNSAPLAVLTQPTVSSLTVSPASPLSRGVPVTWTAKASGGFAALEYRFWIRNEASGAWSVLGDYGPGSTMAWTPTVTGRYYAQVWVRSAGSTAAWEAYANSGSVTVADGPPAPQWTVVTSDGAAQAVAWAVDGQSTAYRVYGAGSRQALLGRLPTVPYTQVSSQPLSVAVADQSVPQYYRVFGVRDGVVGEGGPVAVSMAFATNEVPMTPLTIGGQQVRPLVTPALWDVDGDGCLDLPGARGTCDGRFVPYALDGAGLGGLFAPGRVNRDSRFADLDGDGRTDVFTNVYSPATDSASRAIFHVGDGAATFSEDAAIQALDVAGFGETVVTADFDNDGDIDIFLPHYSHRGDGGHNWLLVNDGLGHFTDVSASAGVASNLPYVPEGAQAIDYNQDGWIDLVVSSHLFINNHDLTFSDRAAAVHLPARFDEGFKFIDVDTDGDFDFVHYDAHVTRLYRNVGGVLDAGVTVDGTDQTTYGYGFNSCDINGDGFEDVVLANNAISTGAGAPRLLLNVGGTLRRSALVTSAGAAYNDVVACADLDRSGLPDIVSRWSALGGFRSLVNRAGSPDTIRLRVLSAGGERNQQGRVVRIRPAAPAGRTLLRVVESGSGYMAQNGYDLLVASPWPGSYEVAVRFADGWFVTTAHPGDDLTIYADHRVAATPPVAP